MHLVSISKNLLCSFVIFYIEEVNTHLSISILYQFIPSQLKLFLYIYKLPLYNTWNTIVPL